MIGNQFEHQANNRVKSKLKNVNLPKSSPATGQMFFVFIYYFYFVVGGDWSCWRVL